ncbi:hypothetical protein ACRALDRAFT_206505 [Sodiomyces alcalophilus JCM 7366]|uniref:uncharacterized protein n=1 Tax=Sodiomyces alcalophilus JCM 7366 TaxID=591952 RepID=UPI0039B46515
MRCYTTCSFKTNSTSSQTNIIVSIRRTTSYITCITISQKHQNAHLVYTNRTATQPQPARLLIPLQPISTHESPLITILLGPLYLYYAIPPTRAVITHISAEFRLPSTPLRWHTVKLDLIDPRTESD